MSLWRRISYGLRGLLRRSTRDREIADEVQQYFEDAVADGMQRGLTREQAVRAARLEAGSEAAARERVTRYGWDGRLTLLGRDLRVALRQLRKHPAFTVTATLTLALGIGANTAIFTVVHAVLLAPLPYQHADRLVAVQTSWSDSGKATPRMTYPDAMDVRHQAHSIAALSLYGQGRLGVAVGKHATYTQVAFIDPQFTAVLGVTPIAGRPFTAGDGHQVAVVGEDFAREHFGSAQAAIGHAVYVEGEPVVITGVLPRGFAFPKETQVWMARPHTPGDSSRTSYSYRAIARLQDGVTFSETQAELDGIAAQLRQAYPVDNRDKGFKILSLQSALTGDVRQTLLLLWGAVGVVLLIACVNVTHLELVRATERKRELSIRRALGASRWQVVQPALLESLFVALAGAALGLLLAVPSVRVLVAAAPAEMPLAHTIGLDGTVLGFTVVLAVAAALLSSLIPALRAAQADPAEALKQEASRGGSGHQGALLRDSLVLAEATATFVLTVGALLLLHTMANLMARDMGYKPRHLLVVDSDLPAINLPQGQKAVQQFYELFGKLRTTPGVDRVAGIMGLPTGDYGSDGYYETRGGLPYDAQHKPYADFSVASPDYFATLGIPLLRGRDFTPSDGYDSGFVAIISQSLARQSFGNADPIGRLIQCGLDSDKWMTVIGVVGDVRQRSASATPGPTLYMPMAQHPFYANQIHIVLRTEVSPLALTHTVQQAITAENPLIATRYSTMDVMMDDALAAQRFRATLLSLFAALAVLLAMLGVYGTASYAVAQRTFEIGLRLALGAERSGILLSILQRTASIAGLGALFGLALSAALAQLVKSMLVAVAPLDPFSLGIAAAMLLGTAVAAAWLPGWRATRIDPARALRAE